MCGFCDGLIDGLDEARERYEDAGIDRQIDDMRLERANEREQGND